MIRLFSIEDHWVVIDGLKTKFRSDRDEIRITCSADNIDKALTIDQNSFDIILLDLLIPGTDPVENVLKLKNSFPGKPIVILTSEESSVWEEQMCEAGVQAYLTKHDTRKKIKTVLKQVSSGEDLCKQKMSELSKKKSGLKSNKNEPFLKPREKEILSLLLQDMNLQQIAEKMLITESAIAKIMAKLRKRFNVKTNSTLLRVILERKLIHPRALSIKSP